LIYQLENHTLCPTLDFLDQGAYGSFEAASSANSLISFSILPFIRSGSELELFNRLSSEYVPMSFPSADSKKPVKLAPGMKPIGFSV